MSRVGSIALKTGGIGALLPVVFFQMLPATMVVAGIRPLFARFHAGQEGAMHAFMAVNMVGAVLAAPLIGLLIDHLRDTRALFRCLAVLDAVLLATLVMPWPTPLILVLRTFEGMAHVGATGVLLAEAAALARDRSDGRTMGLAGAAIIFAIAAGNGIGAMLVEFGERVPFVMAAVIAMLISIFGAAALSGSGNAVAEHALQWTRGGRHWYTRARILIPVLSAFTERFSVGCIIVTFAIFAHERHDLPDARVGLLYFAMTFSFALVMYPVGRLSEVVPRSAVFAVGSMAYAVALLSLGSVATQLLIVSMIAAGVGAGMMFSSTLAYASKYAETGRRGRVMALVNAAGCFGMLMGPAVAGMVSAFVRSGSDPSQRFRVVFGVAAGAILVWLAGSSAWLLTQFELEIAAIRLNRSATRFRGSKAVETQRS